MIKRPWTTREIKVLKLHYGRRSAAFIAESINRTTEAVEQRARTEGLSYIKAKSNQLTPDRLKDYISNGLSKRRIAKESGVNITTVRKYIKLLPTEYQDRAWENGQ